MASLNITKEDIDNINKAISEGGDVWNNKLVADFKRKVKEYYRIIGNEQCCYCKKNFQGEFNMVIDIEHILPKSNSLFRKFMFTKSNLNVACKRCNMRIKGQNIDFITETANVVNDHSNPKYFRFIHPNTDNYFSHLEYYSLIENDHKLIKYKVVAGSSKGQYTFDYFRLHELEIDSISQAQGVKGKAQLSNETDPEIEKALLDIINKL